MNYYENEHKWGADPSYEDYESEDEFGSIDYPEEPCEKIKISTEIKTALNQLDISYENVLNYTGSNKISMQHIVNYSTRLIMDLIIGDDYDQLDNLLRNGVLGYLSSDTQFGIFENVLDGQTFEYTKLLIDYNIDLSSCRVDTVFISVDFFHLFSVFCYLLEVRNTGKGIIYYLLNELCNHMDVSCNKHSEMIMDALIIHGIVRWKSEKYKYLMQNIQASYKQYIFPEFDKVFIPELTNEILKCMA